MTPATADSAFDWYEYTARRFERSEHRWPTPGAMAAELEPFTLQTPALDLIDQTILDVADGRVAKQMIFAPPQTGKSHRAARWTPLWLLADDPSLRVVIISFDSDLATGWSRQIKRDVVAHPSLGITLMRDTQAAGRWETQQGGGVYSTSIAGALSGRSIDMLVIDDPIKGRAAAESKTMRNLVWDWWENVAKVRARKTVLIQTRWHTDDLAGRLLQQEPGEWSVLSLPAIAEREDDPLGREIGEEIQSANPKLHPPGYFHKMEAALSSYVWTSLYQQRPTVAKGGMFKRASWRYWTLGGAYVNLDGMAWQLNDCQRFMTVDLATSTKTSADWTVAAAWAVTPNGDLVLLDRMRERVPEDDHFSLVRPLRQRWLGAYDTVYIESRMFGTTLVYQAGRSGIPIQELKAELDKITRAIPAADLVRQGRVWLPANKDWLDEWIDEHADFGPNAEHDDQVDVLAYAARIVVAHLAPPTDDPVPHDRRIDGDELDILAIPIG